MSDIMEIRRERILSSRMAADGSFTAGDAAHFLSSSKNKLYLNQTEGRELCDWMVEIGDLDVVETGRSRQYFRKYRSAIWWPAPPDNGVPLGRYFPNA
jgi:hypothetical protein